MYGANVGVYSEWHPIASKIVDHLPGAGMSHLFQFTAECMQERAAATVDKKKSGSASDNSFLSQVLRMHSEEPEKVTMVDVFTICLTNIGAGSDTTSISLSAILLNLIQNPETLQRVCEHVDILDSFFLKTLSTSF